MLESRMQRVKVLIVEDDEPTADALRTALASSFSCEVASSASDGLALLGREQFDVVLSDATVRGGGLDLLEAVHAKAPDVPFIVVADRDDIATAIEAGRRGAFDYMVKPLDEESVCGTIERALSEREQRRNNVARDLDMPPVRGEPPIVGASRSFMETLDAVERVAHASAPALLVGETGTGKDLLAARIHARGPRRHRPYIVVNAAAIPATLLDSELFGHVGGAFTGATRARRGLVAEADGGTLFLDEIADLPLELQGRLLRVLESGAIRAVGADHERRVDVRFLAATHRDLSLSVREGKFREDLYFRMNVLAIRVPPLRDRRDDIAPLVDFFFQRARLRNPRSPVREISTEARAVLARAPWPGNVRELSAVIERAVVLGRDAVVEPRDLELSSTAEEPEDTGVWPPREMCSLRTLTSRYVDWVLSRTDGDKSRAASILGVDVSTLYRWQRKRPS